MSAADNIAQVHVNTVGPAGQSDAHNSGPGATIAFCHGLFGQGRNWNGIAKSLAQRGFRSLLVDLPNHGRSAWTEHFSYRETAELVAEELARHRHPADERLVLVGHSLGGKVAMRMALDHPDLVSRLCVVDMAPVRYQRMTSFADYIAGMRDIDLAGLTSRGDADAQLTPAVPDPVVRGFLLQNLRHDTSPGGRGWYWQPNLELFAAELSAVGDWESLPGEQPYQGPVLWVAGGESDYIQPEHAETMRDLFPATRQVTVKRAGHWVHSEQPAVFTQILASFAGADSAGE